MVVVHFVMNGMDNIFNAWPTKYLLNTLHTCQTDRVAHNIFFYKKNKNDIFYKRRPLVSSISYVSWHGTTIISGL